MLYNFVITPSINCDEPGAAYFATLEHTASVTVLTEVTTLEAAQHLCEYLDCVDAGDLKAHQPLYRQGVAALTDYLSKHVNNVTARHLSRKSWAAKTLLELIHAETARSRVVPQFARATL